MHPFRVKDRPVRRVDARADGRQRRMGRWVSAAPKWFRPPAAARPSQRGAALRGVCGSIPLRLLPAASVTRVGREQWERARELRAVVAGLESTAVGRLEEARDRRRRKPPFAAAAVAAPRGSL